MGGLSENADKLLESLSCLTVIRSSLSFRLAPSLLQEIVGSGCPRGGWHSSTAGSPTATITSTGFCLKSSRKTETQRRKEILMSGGIQAESHKQSDFKMATQRGVWGGGWLGRHKIPENSTAILVHPSCWSCLTDLLRKQAAWMADSKIGRYCKLVQSTMQKGEIQTASPARSHSRLSSAHKLDSGESWSEEAQ